MPQLQPNVVTRAEVLRRAKAVNQKKQLFESSGKDGSVSPATEDAPGSPRQHQKNTESDGQVETSPFPDVACLKCGKFMSESQARAMYKEFSLAQFPRRAVFSFENWVVPPNTRCANSREIGKGDPKKTCTLCAGQQDGEERALGDHALEQFNVEDQKVVAQFQGQTGRFELKCSPQGAWASPIELVEDLRRVDVDVKFRYPKAAELTPPSTPGAPTDAGRQH